MPLSFAAPKVQALGLSVWVVNPSPRDAVLDLSRAPLPEVVVLGAGREGYAGRLHIKKRAHSSRACQHR